MKYRKKPVVIEAEQFWPDKKPWPRGVREVERVLLAGVEPIVLVPVVDTLEGQLTVSAGDWIITGIKGEIYPCKPDIFAELYEPTGETRT